MSKKVIKNKFRFLGFGAAVFAVLILSFSVLKTSIQSSRCANSISCIKDLTGEFDPNAKKAEFLGQSSQLPTFVAEKPNTSKVLGEVPASAKRIEVDLGSQMLYAYQNDQVVMSFPISSGKWGKTPTGTFHIWIKLKYTRMSGGSGADYYNLPNVPYVMFFYNEEVSKGRGFSLHGAYWHNNFGYPMSHGCVNISPVNAGKLYDWASPVAEGNITYVSDTNSGTDVIIYGTPPEE
jgi:lipoprotein-anchoring transpeptidase ErfK/SrfK